METNDNTAEVFFKLLATVLEAYDDGYDIGYNDAIEDMGGGEFNVEI